MAKNFKQGYYTPVNPIKYMGDVTKIVYRSSYELEMNRFLDGNQRVLKWGSEIIAIPYIKPTDKKVHKYFVDYYVEYIDKNGEIKKELIEVKPFAQTSAPRGGSKHSLYEQLTYAVNIAKWQACQKWCDAHGITFRIVSEKTLFK